MQREADFKMPKNEVRHIETTYVETTLYVFVSQVWLPIWDKNIPIMKSTKVKSESIMRSIPIQLSRTLHMVPMFTN